MRRSRSTGKQARRQERSAPQSRSRARIRSKSESEGTRRAGRQGKGEQLRGAGHKAAGRDDGLQLRSDMFELEVLDGLVPVCAQEVRALVGRQATLYDSSHPDQLAFEFSGRASRLTKLRTAVAVFKLLYFKVPHPLPIVQGQNLERLITEIEAIRDGARFTSFRIGAAGSDSTAFRRIKSVIAQRTGLVNDEEEGEMSIRFRRSRRNSFGWDVLIRLTPRPLSARTWRIENMPGALNATIAAAMVFQTAPQPSDRFLNLMCGSGTILAERAAICPAERLIGVDVAGSALKSSRANLAHLQTPPMLLQEEIGQLSLSDASVDVICVDLPWGRLIGKQSELGGVYNETMRQASRVCMPGGRFAILTQEIETFESALNPFKRYWDVIAGFRVKQSDYRPKFFLLQRNDRAFSRA